MEPCHMKQSTIIVVYRDAADTNTRYFGPFVSSMSATAFSDRLPTPEAGGFKKYSVLQPFTATEHDLVNDLIMLERSNRRKVKMGTC